MRFLKILYTIIAIICCCSDLSGQKSDYLYTNFSIADGLPSNQTYHVIQDKDGFIWIAGDNGVSKFNGIGFKNYGIDEGLSDITIFNLVEDQHGNIWAGGLKNELYIYKKETDRFEAFKYNNLIKNEIKSGFLEEFIITEDTIYIPTISEGLLKISLNGSITNGHASNDNLSDFVINEINKKAIIYGTKNISLRGYTNPIRNLNLSWLKNTRNTNLHIHKFKTVNTSIRNIAYINDSLYVAYIGTKIFIITNKGIVTNSSKQATYVGKTKKGNVIIGFNHNNGIFEYVDIKNDVKNTIISEISASGFLEDRDHGYWVTSLDKGVFYIKNINIKYLNERTKDGNIIHLAHNYKNLLFTGNQNGSVHRINIENNSLVEYNKPNGYDIQVLAYDTFSKKLWISDYIGTKIYENPSNYRRLISNIYHYRKNISIKGVLFSNKNNLLLLPNGFFLELERSQTKNIAFGSKINRVANSQLLKCVLLNGNQIYFGTSSGLFHRNIYKDTLFTDNSTLQNMPISCIRSYKNSSIIVGTMGSGIAIVNDKDKSCFFINKNSGLLDNQVIGFSDFDKNKIWVAFRNGLSLVEIMGPNKFKIKNFNYGHGIPDVVNGVTLINGRVLVATGSGVIELLDTTLWKQNYAPYIDKFIVNNHSIPFYNKIKLNPDQNNLRIRFYTLNFAYGDRIKYRYRIQKSEWIDVGNEIILFNQKHGKYCLEIQSQNQDGEWGEIRVMDYEILTPWYKTIYAYLSVLLLIGFSWYKWYQYKLKNVQTKFAIENKISELQRSALQAQMNPHFVFNCLNSIQNFIMQNEKVEAMDYLNRFAQLIRKNLEASTSSTILLSDEIEMLHNYIALEQMRFGQNFDYTLHIDTNIDAESTLIPPLLIQPFVENAILHGVSDIHHQGLINIEITKSINTLQITIKDNGRGMSDQQQIKDHKSLAMSITSKRLDYINTTKDKMYNITTTSNHLGTKVIINVHLVDLEP